jgi:hypothetical protein
VGSGGQAREGWRDVAKRSIVASQLTRKICQFPIKRGAIQVSVPNRRPRRQSATFEPHGGPVLPGCSTNLRRVCNRSYRCHSPIVGFAVAVYPVLLPLYGFAAFAYPNKSGPGRTTGQFSLLGLALQAVLDVLNRDQSHG